MLLAIYLTPVARRPLGLGDSGPCWISNQAKALGRSAAAAVAAARSVMLACDVHGCCSTAGPAEAFRERANAQQGGLPPRINMSRAEAMIMMQMSRRRAVCDCRVKARLRCAALAAHGRAGVGGVPNHMRLVSMGPTVQCLRLVW